MTKIGDNLDRYLAEEARNLREKARYEAMADRARMTELKGVKKGKNIPEKGINEIRSRLDVLTDYIESSMEDITGYVAEIRELLVESGENI